MRRANEHFQFEDDDSGDSPVCAQGVVEFPLRVPQTFRVLGPDEVEEVKDLELNEAKNLLIETMIEEMKPPMGQDKIKMEAAVIFLEYLLYRYKWRIRVLGPDIIESPKKVFAKRDFVFNGRGVAPPSALTKDGNENLFFCEICKEILPTAQAMGLPCGHLFCTNDWRRYLAMAITEGQEASAFKCCPQYRCPFMVVESFWRSFVSHEDYARRNNFRRQLFVSSSPKLRNCVEPNCPNVVEGLQIAECDFDFRVGIGGRQPSLRSANVICRCGKNFCFFCGEEPHRPVPCDIIAIWLQKNTNEAANVAWILVNTRNCPSCKQPIEKNQGCMHMTCRCKHEFCWVCLNDWKKHQGGDFWVCNIYKEKPQDTQEAMERRRAKESLERYSHYFERFRAHDHAQRVANLETLMDVEKGMSSRSNPTSVASDHNKTIAAAAASLAGLTDETENAVVGLLELLREAVVQIVECRRILKFSYAFGYYATWTQKPQNKLFFEYQQGELERTLDQLQEMATAETLAKLYNNLVGGRQEKRAEPRRLQSVVEFRTSLVNLTRVVKDFFHNIMLSFEGELLSTVRFVDPDGRLR